MKDIVVIAVIKSR